MSKNGSFLDRLEIVYLKIFKVIIIIVLTIALLLSIGLALRAAQDWFVLPKAPEPARKASPPSVSVDALVKELTRKDEPSPASVERPTPTQPQQPALEKDYEDVAARVWDLSNSFSIKCIPNWDPPLEAKSKFAGSLERWLRERARDPAQGQPFIKAYESFVQQVYAHPEALTICKKIWEEVQRRERQGIFVGAMTFFAREWNRQVREGQQLEQAERQRVKQFEADEQARVFASRATAIGYLTAAGGVFGVFISLALLLIFARIETNLRGGRVLDPEGEKSLQGNP